MKISKKLPQFEKNPAAIIVAGNLTANYYLVNNGEINKVSTLIIKKSHYSDRENFGRRGNIIFESGDRVGAMKKFLQQEFLKGFKNNLKNINNINKVYLFAPSNVIDSLREIISKQIKAPLKLFEGNFLKFHPFKLIEKIK